MTATTNPRTTSRREAYRRDLAEVVRRDPAELDDQARLIEELALDSLDLMSLLAWLDGHGVSVDVARDGPARVGDVLTLLEQAAAFPRLSIRVTGGPAAAIAGDVTIRPRPAADPLAPVLADEGFRLDPISPGDLDFLYALTTQPETCFRWRYRGAPPSYERFSNDLWKQVLVQYVARPGASDQPIGHVMAYGADPAMHYVHIGAVFIAPYAGSGMAARVVVMFLRYLFHTFPLHKVYLEVPGYNWHQIHSGRERLFRIEGILRDHDYYAGRRWDQYLCAVYRDQVGTGHIGTGLAGTDPAPAGAGEPAP
jgi:RimJ/RimL family protein N-acetyltransferase/aryl carrier-like protein